MDKDPEYIYPSTPSAIYLLYFLSIYIMYLLKTMVISKQHREGTTLYFFFTNLSIYVIDTHANNPWQTLNQISIYLSNLSPNQ